jgi:hypothetical protein
MWYGYRYDTDGNHQVGASELEAIKNGQVPLETKVGAGAGTHACVARATRHRPSLLAWLSGAELWLMIAHY